jgi:hypothetical protein
MCEVTIEVMFKVTDRHFLRGALSASFAGWLNGSSNVSVPLSGETLDG